jgi:hypothetical protein
MINKEILNLIFGNLNPKDICRSNVSHEINNMNANLLKIQLKKFLEYNDGEFFDQVLEIMDFPEIIKIILKTFSENKLIEILMNERDPYGGGEAGMLIFDIYKNNFLTKTKMFNIIGSLNKPMLCMIFKRLYAAEYLEW